MSYRKLATLNKRSNNAMPNAKDFKRGNRFSLALFGNTGSGKTTLYLSHPGRKFAYLFDPNALNSLAGQDITYEEFLPDVLNLGIVVQHGPWTPKVGTVKAKDKLTHPVPTAETYVNWEADFYKRINDGFFKEVDLLVFDSLTTFQSMVLDRIMDIQGKLGQSPETDDYIAVVNTVANVFRTVTALNIDVIVTGHLYFVQDERSKQIFWQPVLTGKLRTRLPLLFSEVWATEAESVADKTIRYTVQTRPDRTHQLVRSTWPNLEFKEDVTVDFSSPLTDQGLHHLMKKGGLG